MKLKVDGVNVELSEEAIEAAKGIGLDLVEETKRGVRKALAQEIKN